VYLRTALNADTPGHLVDEQDLAGRSGHMLPVRPLAD